MQIFNINKRGIVKEQTKISILLIAVIVVATASLVFIFYEYGKMQSQFTARAIKTFPIIYAEQQTPSPVLQDVRQLCIRPNCYYNSKYFVGKSEIFTGNNDVNGQDVRGCHSEKTELTMRVKTSTACFTQKLLCVAGGWTLNSEQKHC